MPDADLIKIYRGYSNAELATALADLRAKFDENPEFASAGVGSNTFTRDQSTIQKKLAAAQYVYDERNNAGYQMGGINFSNLSGID